MYQQLLTRPSLLLFYVPPCGGGGQTKCKHVINAAGSFRATCCNIWVECAECHAEQTNHPLVVGSEMVFACKACKKSFKKDLRHFEEEDESCPFCGNCFVTAAKLGEEEA